MSSVQHQIMQQARQAPEGALLAPRSFLHLGSRAAVDQAFSRLARGGELVRVGRGRYVRPRPTRFGRRLPSPEEVVAQIAGSTGETVVPGGASAAHGLGLTSQVPVRPVFLTSGASRTLELGRQRVELRSAPPWLLWGPHTREGDVLRALEWMGEGNCSEAVRSVVESLEPEQRTRLFLACAAVPSGLARVITRAIFPEPSESAALPDA